jgi:hypothetical protein
MEKQRFQGTTQPWEEKKDKAVWFMANYIVNRNYTKME